MDNDHFISVNGYHSEGWIDKDSINPHVPLVSKLCKMIAEETADLRPEIICGPAQGGLIVSLWTGYHYNLSAVFVEHDPSMGNVTAGDVNGLDYRYLLQWKIPSWPENETPQELCHDL